MSGNQPPAQGDLRPLISGANMLALFNNLFTDAKRPECTSCSVPLPFSGPAAGASGVFWYMPSPERCPYGCERVLTQLWARINSEYRIEAPSRVMSAKLAAARA